METRNNEELLAPETCESSHTIRLIVISIVVRYVWSHCTGSAIEQQEL